MAYVRNEYFLGKDKRVVEVEKYYSWNYGAKGEKRKKKKKVTQEVIQKQNELNAEKKLRRKIYHNFSDEGWHLILTYKKENRPDPEKAKKELKNFLDRMRWRYKKYNLPFKYIMTTEYKNKAIHHHLIIEDYLMPDTTTTRLIKDAWKLGNPQFIPLWKDGEFKKLASYIIKETQKSFREEDNPNSLRYSCSRNLIDPKPKKKIIRRRDIEQEPKPRQGYFIDKDSIHEGINPVSGYKYQSYRMIKLDTARKRGG